MLRLATWNVNGIRARIPRLIEWLYACEPDVLCLQETKISDDKFSKEIFSEIKKLDYEVAHYGEKSESGKSGRNGVAIFSRVGIKDVVNGFSKDKDLDARMVWATCGKVRVGSAYVPNGRELTHKDYLYKLDWLGWLKKQVVAEMKSGIKNLVVMGDFNVAPEDIDVWNSKEYIETIYTSPAVRKALSSVIGTNLVEVTRTQYPSKNSGKNTSEEKIFTFWDYTSLKFVKNQGMRIDHIMVNKALMSKLAWTIVDRNMRKGEKPSDHVPVIAEFNI